MMPICAINQKTLQEFREAHVAAKMKEYHARMHEVFEEGLKSMNIEDMKKKILEKVTKEPWKTTIEVSHEFPLKKLFIKKNFFVDDEDGKKKLIINPKEPLECWMSKEGLMGDQLYTNVFRFYEASCYYGDPQTRSQWEEYMYTADPETQALRKRLQEAFPDASLHPMIYGYDENIKFRIAIIHTLPYNIPGSEAVGKLVKTSPGGYVQWEQNPKREYL
jgi:hypothetical protein